MGRGFRWLPLLLTVATGCGGSTTTVIQKSQAGHFTDPTQQIKACLLEKGFSGIYNGPIPKAEAAIQATYQNGKSVSVDYFANRSDASDFLQIAKGPAQTHAILSSDGHAVILSDFKLAAGQPIAYAGSEAVAAADDCATP